MAEYISFQPSDFFSPKLWTGTGAENAITGVGFQPDLVWAKQRSGTEYHEVCDAVRGATKILYTNADSAEGTNAQTLKTFDADGYTLGTSLGWNGNTSTYVGWNWKAGTTTGLSGGTITPSSYSINATAGIGVYAYAGTGSNGTIAHGLGTGSKFIIVKNISDPAGYTWRCTSSRMQIDSGAYYVLYLSTTANETNDATAFNSTLLGDTVFNLGTSAGTNASGSNYIAYLFSSKKGFSAFGTYKGTGDASISPFIYTGFRPAYTMIKQSSGSGTYGWYILDSKRAGYNPDNEDLLANTTGAEDDSNNFWDLLSNGFKIKTAGGNVNTSGSIYTYAAFAEFPLVSSNDIPTVAR